LTKVVASSVRTSAVCFASINQAASRKQNHFVAAEKCANNIYHPWFKFFGIGVELTGDHQ
jgi:hypothetical protein